MERRLRRTAALETQVDWASPPAAFLAPAAMGCCLGSGLATQGDFALPPAARLILAAVGCCRGPASARALASSKATRVWRPAQPMARSSEAAGKARCLARPRASARGPARPSAEVAGQGWHPG